MMFVIRQCVYSDLLGRNIFVCEILDLRSIYKLLISQRKGAQLTVTPVDKEIV